MHFISDVGQFVTTITLDHTLYTGLSNPPQRPAPAPAPPAWIPPRTTRQPDYATTRMPFRPQTQPPIYRPPIQVVPTVKPNSNEDVHNEFDFECGGSDYRAPTATGLIHGGQNANRGQFPW